MKELKRKEFSNGVVYALETWDNYPIEVTSTHLPYYTKNCINDHTNKLKDEGLGDYTERYMIGVSCMSGCPVGCKFCATGQLKKWRNLTADEIVSQIEFVIEKNKGFKFGEAKENKINYTRMGEPFLNIQEVKKAIDIIDNKYPNVHHYISTVGLKNSDFSWIKDNITLQLSLHSLIENKRDWLIPIKNKMSIKELGQVKTKSHLKTTINMTLVDKSDFDINIIKQYFNKDDFFIKLSPINPNSVSSENNMGNGVIETTNLK